MGVAIQFDCDLILSRPNAQGRTEAEMFQLTLRELLLVIGIVAMSVAWWMDHTRLVAKHERSFSAVGRAIHQWVQERDNAISERDQLRRQIDESTATPPSLSGELRPLPQESRVIPLRHTDTATW